MDDESRALLPVPRTSRKHGYRCKSTICIHSKAAVTVLLWNFAALLGYKVIYNTDAIMELNAANNIYLRLGGFVGLSIIAALAPIIGILADIRLSRYKAVLCSSYISIIIQILVFLLVIILSVIAVTLPLKQVLHELFAVLLLTGALKIVVHIILFINGFQFGMDQLQSSSTEDLVLFIHWYVWLYYLSTFITKLQWNLFFFTMYSLDYLDTVRIAGICTMALITATTIALLVASLCVLRHRRVWFLLEPPGLSPYKLVYGVLKFAFQHKVPVRRSAFTYCEDEFPSRLDLGKQKYGGPFTTSQVEDVKAFLGILKFLLTLGPVFSLQIVIPATLPLFATHGNSFMDNATKHVVYSEGTARHIFISNGLLSPLVAVIGLPAYLCFIRQHIFCFPGLFRRIGFGLLLIALSLFCAFVMDYVVHAEKTEYANCMFHVKGKLWHFIGSNATDCSSPPFFQSVYFFIPQYILSSLSNMLIDIAVLEFVCSQSPYNMKGMVFGLVFLTKHFFHALAFISISPFSIPWNRSFPLSCCSTFYLMHTIIAVFSLVLFSCVTRRYKYRNTNEPSNVYRYAEEYYSR